MFRTILASALTLSAITAVPAIAAPGDPSVNVSYADLNVTSPAGITVLERRIRAAADRICGSASVKDLTAAAEVGHCRKVAMASTRTQVAMLTTTGVSLASR